MEYFIGNKHNQIRPIGLKYSPQTGLFYKSRIRKNKDTIIGTHKPILQKNRIYQRLNYKSNGKTKEISLHRLAFIMMNKKLPNGNYGYCTCIDHINGNTHDNRWRNLRIISKRGNDLNKRCHREGKLSGCRKATKGGKWEARIVINSKLIHIGTFEGEKEAHYAYLKALENWEKNGIKPNKQLYTS